MGKLAPLAFTFINVADVENNDGSDCLKIGKGWNDYEEYRNKEQERKLKMNFVNNKDILQFFQYTHLKPEMQNVSKPFHDMAHEIIERIPPNPERSVALRKLLEAKDAAVRAFIFQVQP